MCPRVTCRSRRFLLGDEYTLDLECTLCLVACRISWELIPCGHSTLCEECARSLVVSRSPCPLHVLNRGGDVETPCRQLPISCVPVLHARDLQP